MKIAVGADHAGFEMKERVKEHLSKKGYQVSDKGTDSGESTDYPPFAHQVAEEVTEKKADRGIVICGSGNGVAMSANKHHGIRCALCWTKEISELARAHNDANVLAIPSRFVSETEAIEMVDAFLTTTFEGGRHERRVNKIDHR